MTSAKGIGIPIKLMHEAEGHVITVSLPDLANERELGEAGYCYGSQLADMYIFAFTG